MILRPAQRFDIELLMRLLGVIYRLGFAFMPLELAP